MDIFIESVKGPRKVISVLLFLVMYFSSQAQLSVRNDNFLFVSDEVLFIDEGLNLAEADSKLYLRNEGQLIQGNEVSSNTGLGELSVYQKGNVSNYQFNYWCLPVGNNSSLSGNEDGRVALIDEATGIITTEDPLGLTSSIDVSFTSNNDGFSSPVLTVSNRWLFTFSNSDNFSSWNSLNENSNIRPGLGFTMKGVTGTNNQLYDLRGKPNNGTISNFISADNFTLIGNPYPSAIDALLFIHDPDNTNLNNGEAPLPSTTGALYFWEQENIPSHRLTSYIGGYAAYTISNTGVESFVPAIFTAFDNLGNPIPLPPQPGGNTGSKISKRYIPIGQGFMVEGASSATSGTSVYVKNEHRAYEKISDGESFFFRSTSSSSSKNGITNPSYNEYGLNIVPKDHKRFRLNVTFNDDYTRQLMHNFHNTATVGFDYGLEAKLASGDYSDASWTFNDEDYSIQASAYVNDLVIPIVVKTDVQQPLRFSIFDVQNFEDSQPIYLHDIKTDVFVDLTQQDYELNIDAGNFPTRFEIVFEMNTSLNLKPNLQEDFEVFVNRKNSNLVVLNPNLMAVETFSVFDTSGKLVLSNTIRDVSPRYSFPSENLSDGVYLVEININGQSSFTKKLIIKQ